MEQEKSDYQRDPDNPQAARLGHLPAPDILGPGKLALVLRLNVGAVLTVHFHPTMLRIIAIAKHSDPTKHRMFCVTAGTRVSNGRPESVRPRSLWPYSAAIGASAGNARADARRRRG